MWFTLLPAEMLIDVEVCTLRKGDCRTGGFETGVAEQGVAGCLLHVFWSVGALRGAETSRNVVTLSITSLTVVLVSVT